MTEATQASKPAKAATVYTDITMEDGRVVKFAGNRKSDKTILTDDAGLATGVRFDFVNGKTLSIVFSEIPESLIWILPPRGPMRRWPAAQSR